MQENEKIRVQAHTQFLCLRTDTMFSLSGAGKGKERDKPKMGRGKTKKVQKEVE